jgi:ectoine hydroxylase-related dioxygenase (phytanoyl-CoA dioxygenase family)
MSRGSVLLYSGNVLHSGGANQTAHTRIGLYLGYIPFWLQPLENPAATHPPGFLDGLDAQTRSFLSHHPGGFSALLG